MRKRFVCVLLILMLSLALLPTTAFADEDIIVTKENFPDDNFRKYIIGRFCDSGGVLYASTIESAVYISVSNQEIRSLKGIELFPHLERLECGGNALSELDLSANPELKSLDCSENALTTLDVGGNQALTNLNCSANKLAKLDVSGNRALTWLNCGSNQLTALDVSGNTALERLECGWNRLSSLDVSGNPALEGLRCNDNRLTALDVTANKALTWLICGGNKLTALDVTNGTALKTLDCGNNQLRSLDVSGHAQLESLNCSKNRLTELDLTSNRALDWLECSQNQLKKLNLRRNTALRYLNCSTNKLTALILRSCPELYTLRCFSNQIKTLDLSNSPSLLKACRRPGLKADGDGIYYGPSWFEETDDTASMIISKGTKVITELVPEEGVEVNETSFPDEAFREYIRAAVDNGDDLLTADEIEAVASITAEDLGIESLQGVEIFVNLNILNCRGNALTALDVSGNTALRVLLCDGNRLNELDISHNPGLRKASAGKKTEIEPSAYRFEKTEKGTEYRLVIDRTVNIPGVNEVGAGAEPDAAA